MFINKTKLGTSLNQIILEETVSLNESSKINFNHTLNTVEAVFSTTETSTFTEGSVGPTIIKPLSGNSVVNNSIKLQENLGNSLTRGHGII